MNKPRFKHLIDCNEEQEKRASLVRMVFKVSYIDLFMKGIEYYEYLTKKSPKKETKQEPKDETQKDEKNI